MSLHAIYIACYRFDDFKSVQGQICRGYTMAVKLEHHLTLFTSFQLDDGKQAEHLAI
jgi:hypothetical protein